MIIGIDANEANVKRKVGISEYAYELILQFEKMSLFNADKTIFQIYLKEKPLEDFPKGNEKLKYKVFGPRMFWTQIGLPWKLYTSRPQPDIFFTTSHYAPRFSPVPTVVSVMDLSYLYFPDMFKKEDLLQLKHWTAYSVRKAQRIITISKSSKNDIIKEYNIAEEKIVVIYPGIKPAIYQKQKINGMNNVKTKYGISDNFLLFVGTIQPRKNIGRLIEAFAKTLRLIDAPKDLELIIVGRKGWLYEEIFKKPKELGIEEKVKFLDFVPDDELVTLYKQAMCFILPSLYEGFGLPVLEAMRNECPVITSNISSLPEAGGDAALYINPTDINDMSEKIIKMVKNPELRKELKEKGKKHLAKFSWEKTAGETIKVLEAVVRDTHI